jgi:hypothetical protein
MTKQRSFIVDTTESICDIQKVVNYSLAIELELHQYAKVIIGFLLVKNELVDTLVIKDQLSRKKIVIERHAKFNESIKKGKLIAKSVISESDNDWRLSVTMNDVECIISWYLHSVVDDAYQNMVLDIECEEANMIMFAIKQTDIC